jgi:hypothetical protein
MATIQTINIGTYANDGTGDDLRTAFNKVNANFASVNTQTINTISNLGSGTGVYSGLVSGNLEFKSLVAGANVSLSTDANTVTIASTTWTLAQDPSPVLGNNLSLNSHNIVGTGNIGITGSITATNIISDITSAGTSSFNTATATNLTVTNLTATQTISGNISGSSGTVTSLATNQLAQLGDVSDTAATNGQFLSWTGSQWAPTTAAGNVTGPNISFTNYIPTFGDSSGKSIQNSLVSISSTGAITAPVINNSIPFYYPNRYRFPTPGNVTGAVAYSAEDNILYYSGSVSSTPAWQPILSSVSQDPYPQLSSELDVNGQAITTTVTNGNIVIIANGSTGTVNINSPLNVSSISSSSGTINLIPTNLVIGANSVNTNVSFQLSNYPSSDLLVSQAFNYVQNHTNVSAVPLTFYRTRKTVFGSIPLSANDELGGIRFDGYVSNGRTKGASITALVDGTVTSSVMPTSIVVTTNNNSLNTWKFGYNGSFTTGAIITTVTPGNYTFDASSSASQVTLTVGGTVAFSNFSGSILVNCYNSGTVTQYLCGGGGTPVAVGSSKVSPTGTMASTSGISGYTFTATEAGVHSFYVIRTRTGA